LSLRWESGSSGETSCGRHGVFQPANRLRCLVRAVRSVPGAYPSELAARTNTVMTRLYAGSEQSSGQMRILQVVGTLAPCYGGPSIACPEFPANCAAGTPSFHLRQRRGGQGIPGSSAGSSGDRARVEIRYFSALARPDKYMFSPKLWSALGETVGAIRRRPHLVGVRFFQCGRSLLVPQAPGAAHPLSARLARSLSAAPQPPAKVDLYQAFCRARVPQGFGDYVQYQRRNASGFGLVGLATGAGGNGSLPKRYVVPIGLDPGWFREPDSAAGQRFRQRFPALQGRPPGGLFRAAQLQEGARPSGPWPLPRSRATTTTCIWFSPDRAMKITSAR